MREPSLSDRDIFAIYKVLNKAMDEAESCFDGVRHARVVTLMLQQYVESKVAENGKDYEESLKLNL